MALILAVVAYSFESADKARQAKEKAEKEQAQVYQCFTLGWQLGEFAASKSGVGDRERWRKAGHRGPDFMDPIAHVEELRATIAAVGAKLNLNIVPLMDAAYPKRKPSPWITDPEVHYMRDNLTDDIRTNISDRAAKAFAVGSDFGQWFYWAYFACSVYPYDLTRPHPVRLDGIQKSVEHANARLGELGLKTRVRDMGPFFGDAFDLYKYAMQLHDQVTDELHAGLRALRAD